MNRIRSRCVRRDSMTPLIPSPGRPKTTSIPRSRLPTPEERGTNWTGEAGPAPSAARCRVSELTPPARYRYQEAPWGSREAMAVSEQLRTVYSDYSPGEDRPTESYVVLMAAF